MKNTAVLFWILLAAVLVGGYGSFVLYRQMESHESLPAAAVAVVPPATTSAASQSTPADGPVAPFTLTDESGHEFDSASLDGEVWVCSFFFTNCPAVCWRMNQALAAWQHAHPDSKIRFISITCDPDNDTPEALAKYAAHFKADPERWTFLTGDMEKIQSIGQDSFKIAVVRGDHTDRACVVDRSGKVRGRFRLTEPDQAEMLARLLDVVEAEPAPAKDAAEQPPERAAAEGSAGEAAPS